MLFPSDSVGMHGGGGGYGSEVSSIGTSSGGGGPMLSQQPQPEFWCSIAYFELDTQVSFSGSLGPNKEMLSVFTIISVSSCRFFRWERRSKFLRRFPASR
jgi:hypothetical protein